MTITDFLLARIADDEYDARDGGIGAVPSGCWGTGRVIRECEAKRRIVKAAGGWLENDPSPPPWSVFAMSTLASIYADHPDYREEWRP